MLNIFLIIFKKFKHLTIYQYLYYFHSVLNTVIQSPLSCKKGTNYSIWDISEVKREGFGGKKLKKN
jgi:hypothetical protein